MRPAQTIPENHTADIPLPLLLLPPDMSSVGLVKPRAFLRCSDEIAREGTVRVAGKLSPWGEMLKSHLYLFSITEAKRCQPARGL